MRWAVKIIIIQEHTCGAKRSNKPLDEIIREVYLVLRDRIDKGIIKEIDLVGEFCTSEVEGAYQYLQREYG